MVFKLLQPGTRVFKIQLLHTNGSRKGKRHAVDVSPFVIGRHESCQLQFETRTISRKHCAILIEDDRVVVRDLKSRNGTAVDGEKVSPGESVELWHHCVLNIGKYAFRISIRDKETNQPFRPELVDLTTLSGQKIPEMARSGNARQLLTELEDLATRLDPDEADPIFESTISSEDDLVRGGSADDSVGSPDDTMEQEPDAGDSDDSTVMLNADSVVDDDSKLLEESLEDDSKGPGKLPDHLKPKGPKDSQDAAAAALKNLFVK